MNNNYDTQNDGYKKLKQIIGKAIESDTETVTLEYADGGLEIFYICGNRGTGDIVDSVMGQKIISLIVDMAELDDKDKGTIVWTHSEKQHKIAVESYDSFGESAFRFILKRDQPRQPQNPG